MSSNGRDFEIVCWHQVGCSQNLHHRRLGTKVTMQIGRAAKSDPLELQYSSTQTHAGQTRICLSVHRHHVIEENHHHIIHHRPIRRRTVCHARQFWWILLAPEMSDGRTNAQDLFGTGRRPSSARQRHSRDPIHSGCWITDRMTDVCLTPASIHVETVFSRESFTRES